MKEAKTGMKSPTMPKEHFERKEKDVGTSNLKYGTEMGNPQDLDRSTEGLSNYVRKNKAKH